MEKPNTNEAASSPNAPGIFDPAEDKQPMPASNEQYKSSSDQLEYYSGPNGKRVLTEVECYEELGFCWPSWKKWMVISVIFLVQVSMNFNTSLYSNGIGGIAKEFGVSETAARCGAMIYLVMYAFGCELWAPWSEELGRKPILQLSMFLTNVWQLPVALAPNFASIMVGRAFGGLSLAGGSVTLGMVADLWEADTQQYAVAAVVFSSVGGSVLGPLIGGFVQKFMDWRWTIWIQLIFGGFVQIVHLLIVPETRTTIMLDNLAKKKRKNGQEVYGPHDLIPWKQRFSMKEILLTWIRPFHMFVTEPIVLILSLLSGFSDALIFMYIQSYALVYVQWGFGPIDIGLSFIAILVGYILAWASFIPAIRRNQAERQRRPDDERTQYESRLWWLLYTAPCLPIGLIGFAWTSTGPPIHWMGSMVFSAFVGVANYSIYMATIDYMVCAYGPYSASATGGNGFARDMMAGVLTIPAIPFFKSKCAPFICPLDSTDMAGQILAGNNITSHMLPLFFSASLFLWWRQSLPYTSTDRRCASARLSPSNCRTSETRPAGECPPWGPSPRLAEPALLSCHEAVLDTCYVM
jgi:MFS family permease